MSARNRGLLRMRRVLNVRSACSLPKSWTHDWFHVVHGSVAPHVTLWWRRWRWLVDEGRSLSMMSHVFVLFTDLYNQWLRFVHSITKKQGTLVMAITHSFQSILTTDGSIIRIAISYVRCTVAAARQRLSWYTDGISHEFHKNGKTYQNTDSMSLLEMKQLSCDYFIKSWKLLESGFPDRYFGRSMLDCKPYCEQSSHMYWLHCTCNAWDVHSVHSQCCCCCCCCCCLVYNGHQSVRTIENSLLTHAQCVKITS